MAQSWARQIAGDSRPAVADPGHHWLRRVRGGARRGALVGVASGGIAGGLCTAVAWPVAAGVGTLFGLVIGGVAGVPIGALIAALSRSWPQRTVRLTAAALCGGVGWGGGELVATGSWLVGRALLIGGIAVAAGIITGATLGPAIATGRQSKTRRGRPVSATEWAPPVVWRSVAVGAAAGLVIALVSALVTDPFSAGAAATAGLLIGALDGLLVGLLLCAVIAAFRLRSVGDGDRHPQQVGAGGR